MNDSSGRESHMSTMDSTSTQFGFPSRAAITSTVAVVLVFTALLGFLYAQVLRDLVRDWWDDPNYSHGFLVPMYSGFLIWQRRREIAAAAASGGSWMGLPLLLAGLCSLLFGDLAGENFLMRSSLIVVLGGLILLHLGSAALRLVLFPLAFLFFMVPLP